MNFVLFKKSGKKHWQMVKEMKADSFSSALIILDMSPKKIKFKSAKGSGDEKRLESIRFKYHGTNYCIMNCLENGYFG